MDGAGEEEKKGNIEYSGSVSSPAWALLGFYQHHLRNRKKPRHSDPTCRNPLLLVRPLFSCARRLVPSHLLSGPHMAFSLCTFILGISSDDKDTSPIALGPHPHDWPHLTLITSLKALSPNTVTLGVRTSAYEFWKDTIQSVIHGYKNSARSSRECVCMFMLICVWTPPECRSPCYQLYSSSPPSYRRPTEQHITLLLPWGSLSWLGLGELPPHGLTPLRHCFHAHWEGSQGRTLSHPAVPSQSPPYPQQPAKGNQREWTTAEKGRK